MNAFVKTKYAKCLHMAQAQAVFKLRELVE